MRRLVPNLDEHLTDDQLASLFCDELPLAGKMMAKRHLATCWHCRMRKEDLEGRRADRMVEIYREAIDCEEAPLPDMPDNPRAEFLQRLQSQIGHAAPRPRRALRWSHMTLPEFPYMHPTLATCMLLGLATAISFFTWWQQRPPGITSNALLVRAVRWDAPALRTSGGVVFQKVRITAPDQTMERSIYRDPEGKRQPRRVKLTAGQERLRSALAQAGLDWDAPISASGYQGWHDRQHGREDNIVRAGKHLLKLTTTVSDGSVEEQSLTVRDTDFHPVRRTVAFRDNRTVEVSEVDFKILPWSAVDENAFEPIANVESAVARTPTRVLPFPRMPETLSSDQLDEAELGARLVLNQLHADTGEQIEIGRISQGVEVKGLVETEDRKRELQKQLRIVPHLTVSIQSVADLKESPGASKGISSIETASMPDQPSPLEVYLLAQGRSVSGINVLARRLFNAALTVSQESKAIDDLRIHFAAGEQKTLIASATLSELIYSHRERLQFALKQERQLLAEAGSVSAATEAWVGQPGSSSLMNAAARNLALCKELTQTGGLGAQSAEKILASMSISVEELTASTHHAYAKPQGDSPSSGKN